MNKKILHLAIPNIISNISIPLLGIVDTALMGHLEDEAYLGAIALAGVLFNFIYWGLGFLRMGTTGLTAQAYGKGDNNAIILVFSQAMLVALVSSFTVLLLQIPIEILGFSILDGSQKVTTYAREYFYIRIWAAPATIAIYVLNGWFLGMQNARYLMYITVCVNLINIVANFIFVYYFNMNANGVALGTVIAQYTGAGLGVGLFLLSYRHYLSFFNSKSLFNIAAFKQFFTVNRDIFIRTICLLFTFSFFTNQSAAGGDTLLAANQILIQIFYLMAYAIDGFAFAAESLTGNYIGAKNRKLLHKSIVYIFYWGTLISLLYCVLFWLFGDALLQVFTNKSEVIALAKKYMLWVILIPLPGAVAFIWDGIYIGATASVSMRNNMLISTFFIYLPLYFILNNYIGNHALWVSLNAFMLMRGIGLTLTAKKAIYGQIG